MERRWLGSYPSAVPPSLAPYPDTSLYRLLVDAAERYPDAPATVFFGKRLTYAELTGKLEHPP